MTTADDESLGSGRMTFVAHLAELRKRLLWAIVVVFLTTLVAFNFAPQLFEWLRRPLAEILKVKMVVLDPLEMFITYLKLALLAGIFASAPWLLLQLWLFISPGLYKREKRWIAPFVILGSLFFVGGGAFGFYVVLPMGFHALVKLTPAHVQTTYSVARYFTLVVRLLLAFGIVFELPLVMWIIAAAGLVSPKTMSKGRKYWLVLAFVIGAVLTPPDPFTQLLMAIPLVLFFEVGMLGARMLYHTPEEVAAGK